MPTEMPVGAEYNYHLLFWDYLALNSQRLEWFGSWYNFYIEKACITLSLWSMSRGCSCIHE